VYFKKAFASKSFLFLFYCLVGFFIFAIVRDADLTRLQRVSWRIEYLIGAILVAVVFRYLGVIAWINILRQIGCNQLPSFTVLSAVYSKAWMGRYIPGKVAWIVGKVIFGSRYGISTDRLAIGSVLEALLQIVTMFGFSLFIILMDSRLNVLGSWSVPALMVVVVVFLTILSPGCFTKLIKFAYKVSGKSPSVSIVITNQLMTTSFGIYALGYLVSGISYFILINSVYALSTNDLFFVVAAFNIAGVAGMVALFAPSGIGVREGVLLILLPMILPTEIALLVVVLARVFSLLVDIGFFLISHLPMVRLRQKSAG